VQFDSDLTIEEDDKEDKDNKGVMNDMKKARRNKKALEMLADRVRCILLMHKEAFYDMLIAKPPQDGEFRLVVAIDEASTCPLLARAVISDYSDFFASGIAETILGELPVSQHLTFPDIVVKFSVGGTGAAMATIGSLPQNFDVITPTAAERNGLYWKTVLRAKSVSKILPGQSEPATLLPDQVTEKLPILYRLMENGRMASIAISILFSKQDDVIDEAKMVETMVEDFIASNGLSALRWPQQREPAAATAACAFAVYLFQWSHEKPSKEAQRSELYTWLLEMRCGLEFEADVRRVVDTSTNGAGLVKTLVATYGLLEPSDRPIFNSTIQKPFEMRVSQQLVALHLLGVDLSEMVAANPYGFEVMSTQIIKAALAASSVVLEASRPSIGASLKKIGFQMQPSITHQTTDQLFARLDSCKVIPHYFGDTSENPLRFITHLMKVEMETGYIEYSDGKEREVVMLDSVAASCLDDVRHHHGAHESCYYPPIACVNYGNSQLADGFVTCFARDERDQNIFRFSVMNQAKDKHSTGGMPISKLNAHAKRCEDGVLCGLFGSQRLLCVSAPHDHLIATNKCKLLRKFIPYLMSDCCILRQVMEQLSDQRSKDGRIDRHGVYFTKEKVDVFQEDK